jgi:heme/copper-type cytochrome/quinol oxidase subunit 2
MAPSLALRTTGARTSGKKFRFNTPLVIGVVAIILVAFIVLVLYIMWKSRRHVKASNKIRHEAVEADQSLLSK